MSIVDPAQARASTIMQSVQLITALVFVPVLYVLCRRLPVRVGWENGFFEMGQNLVAILAVLVSLGMAWRRRVHAQRRLWWTVALGWLLLLGCELRWGAVWLPPLAVAPRLGPQFDGAALPLQAAVPLLAIAVLAVLALMVWLLWRAGMHGLADAWRRRVLMPWGHGLAAAAYGLAAWAGQQGWVDADAARGQSLAQGAAMLAYYYLLRAQWWAFARWLKP
ncbi:hypothetical protein D8I35_15495 [Corticibacter populi]|uniref:Uncharacterized protein n=1 Tax=Corticibacter populi TaxID=1550736 RepID=A0A3M6QMC9_9BURK|nr:hypothetical protein [Corticibacter populi]RMX04204.1 hypothetical protein D8I35_15495 [Corticibacter populi]RZS33231.1 hypothetical protein EV687_1552 [Corticibacter populi]